MSVLAGVVTGRGTPPGHRHAESESPRDTPADERDTPRTPQNLRLCVRCSGHIPGGAGP